MGGEYELGTTGKDVAAVIDENFDEVADLLIAAFIREYPHSKSNEFGYEALKKWTHAELQDLTKALRNEGELEPRNIIYAGDIQVRVDALFQPIVAYTETRLFLARNLAPYVWKQFAEDPIEAQRALEFLEDATLDTIRVNMENFIDRKLVPGSISQRWSLGLMHGTEDEAVSDASGFPIPPLWDNGSALTKREQEVAVYVAQGKTNGEIAGLMDISQNTVKNHLSRVYDKLNVNTRAELTRRVIANGWA